MYVFGMFTDGRFHFFADYCCAAPSGEPVPNRRAIQGVASQHQKLFGSHQVSHRRHTHVHGGAQAQLNASLSELGCSCTVPFIGSS
jgi:hypothetical protein